MAPRGGRRGGRRGGGAHASNNVLRKQAESLGGTWEQLQKSAHHGTERFPPRNPQFSLRSASSLFWPEAKLVDPNGFVVRRMMFQASLELPQAVHKDSVLSKDDLRPQKIVNPIESSSVDRGILSSKRDRDDEIKPNQSSAIPSSLSNSLVKLPEIIDALKASGAMGSSRPWWESTDYDLSAQSAPASVPETNENPEGKPEGKQVKHIKKVKKPKATVPGDKANMGKMYITDGFGMYQLDTDQLDWESVLTTEKAMFPPPLWDKKLRSKLDSINRKRQREQDKQDQRDRKRKRVTAGGEAADEDKDDDASDKEKSDEEEVEQEEEEENADEILDEGDYEGGMVFDDDEGYDSADSGNDQAVL